MNYSMFFEILKQYSESGLFFVLFLFAILFLGLKMVKAPEKKMVVWYPIFVLVVFFCPLWLVYDKMRDDSGILYRILWMVPMSIIVCYGLIMAVFMLPEKCRIVGFGAALLLIILSGKYVYANPFFSKAENEYHVPETVVKICDELMVEGREVRVCMPLEFIQYARQYSPYIVLTYGRDVLLYDYGDSSSNMTDFFRDEVYNAYDIATELKRTSTPYFVVRKDVLFTESMGNYGYYYYDTIDDYDIYLDSEAYLGL